MDPEKMSAAHDDVVVETVKPSDLKLDSNGFPLDPQPSDHPDDPLNWPLWGKVYIALMVSGLGFISQMGSALINPSVTILSTWKKVLTVTPERSSSCRKTSMSQSNRPATAPQSTSSSPASFPCSLSLSPTCTEGGSCTLSSLPSPWRVNSVQVPQVRMVAS